ncbi:MULTISPECIES: NmrA family NAD(P)-binding protein [unclassified Rhizobium]|uniref:NmrA family NAD(P)-binding protein n=1 Tax=unclassified Rhizobium TaxID=2613769 RepID=UPI001C833F3F|nr:MULTISPECIES: NmrA family NAD(P)-binding protein [unclassified Rhizobium]MBX5163286.1 NmrA family NAD(P)-binding protein [Rhizobium sp. NZLR4b]MBX5207705.1 NmrA family NAD(P)-binding protein [Rhizobium sp. NZLR11]
MPESNPKVLVIGATGKFARLVMPALARRNVTVRALVRYLAKDVQTQVGATVDVIEGDLRNAESLDRACDGVDGVFYIGPAFAPDEAAMGVSMIEAAERSGVRKFVFSSVIQPTNTRLKNHASKIPVEEALYSSRLQYTILHPANFMQNIALAWPNVLETSTFSEPFPKTARIARVDYRDVADVAAEALTSDRLAFATLELCSEGLYHRGDIAEMMSEALGRHVEALEPSFAEWASSGNLPYNDHQLHLLSKVHEHYARFGLGGNSLTLRAALGREPRSLHQFIGDLKAGQY